jgi:poly(3-hydroxybutyrate) depolymerase
VAGRYKSLSLPDVRDDASRPDLKAIRHAGLMTVEGEKDDISGVGQTAAAQDLCSSIPVLRKAHYTQNGVGHYGVFNGSRFRAEIAPRISDFIASVNQRPETGRLLECASPEACRGPAAEP